LKSLCRGPKTPRPPCASLAPGLSTCSITWIGNTFRCPIRNIKKASRG
jgi:hypothetical protein